LLGSAEIWMLYYNGPETCTTPNYPFDGVPTCASINATIDTLAIAGTIFFVLAGTVFFLGRRKALSGTHINPVLSETPHRATLHFKTVPPSRICYEPCTYSPSLLVGWNGSLPRRGHGPLQHSRRRKPGESRRNRRDCDRTSTAGRISHYDCSRRLDARGRLGESNLCLAWNTSWSFHNNRRRRPPNDHGPCHSCCNADAPGFRPSLYPTSSCGYSKSHCSIGSMITFHS